MVQWHGKGRKQLEATGNGSCRQETTNTKRKEGTTPRKKELTVPHPVASVTRGLCTLQSDVKDGGASHHGSASTAGLACITPGASSGILGRLGTCQGCHVSARQRQRQPRFPRTAFSDKNGSVGLPGTAHDWQTEQGPTHRRQAHIKTGWGLGIELDDKQEDET